MANSVVIDIDASTKQFESALDALAKKVESTASQMDKAFAVNGNAEKQIKSTSNAVSGLNSALRDMSVIAAGNVLADAFTKPLNEIKKLGKQIYATTEQMQGLEMAMKSIVSADAIKTGKYKDYSEAIKHAEKDTQDLMAWFKKLSLVSPYEYTDVIEAFKTNANMGQSVETAKKTTKAILELGSGLGMAKANMKGFSIALAQTGATGKITATDIRQFANNGFGMDKMNAIFDMISQKYGIIISDHNDFNNAVKSGKITVDAFFDALGEYADTNYGGAVEAMASTIGGLKSSLSDIKTNAINDLFLEASKTISTTLKPYIEYLMELLTTGSFTNWGHAINTWVEGIVEPFKKIGELMEDGRMMEALNQLIDFFSGKSLNLGAVETLMKSLMGENYNDDWYEKLFKIRDIFDWLVRNKETILDVFRGIGIAIGTALATKAISNFGNMLLSLNNPATQLILLGSLIGIAWNKNFLGIQDRVNEVIESVRNLYASFQENGWDGLREGVSGIIEKITNDLSMLPGKIRTWFEENKISLKITTFLFGEEAGTEIDAFINENVGRLSKAIEPIREVFENTFGETVQKTIEEFKKIINEVKERFDSDTWVKFGNTLREIGLVIGGINILIHNMALGSIDEIVATIGDAVEDLLTILQRVAEVANDIWDVLAGLISGDFKRAKSGAESLIPDVQELAFSIQVAIENFLLNVYSLIVNAVVSTAEAMAIWIKERSHGLVDMTGDVKNLKDTVTSGISEGRSRNDARMTFGFRGSVEGDRMYQGYKQSRGYEDIGTYLSQRHGMDISKDSLEYLKAVFSDNQNELNSLIKYGAEQDKQYKEAVLTEFWSGFDEKYGPDTYDNPKFVQRYVNELANAGMMDIDAYNVISKDYTARYNALQKQIAKQEGSKAELHSSYLVLPEILKTVEKADEVIEEQKDVVETEKKNYKIRTKDNNLPDTTASTQEVMANMENGYKVATDKLVETGKDALTEVSSHTNEIASIMLKQSEQVPTGLAYPSRGNVTIYTGNNGVEEQVANAVTNALSASAIINAGRTRFGGSITMFTPEKIDAHKKEAELAEELAKSYRFYREEKALPEFGNQLIKSKYISGMNENLNTFVHALPDKLTEALKSHIETYGDDKAAWIESDAYQNISKFLQYGSDLIEDAQTDSGWSEEGLARAIGANFNMMQLWDILPSDLLSDIESVLNANDEVLSIDLLTKLFSAVETAVNNVGIDVKQIADDTESTEVEKKKPDWEIYDRGLQMEYDEFYSGFNTLIRTQMVENGFDPADFQKTDKKSSEAYKTAYNQAINDLLSSGAEDGAPEAAKKFYDEFTSLFGKQLEDGVGGLFFGTYGRGSAMEGLFGQRSTDLYMGLGTVLDSFSTITKDNFTDAVQFLNQEEKWQQFADDVQFGTKENVDGIINEMGLILEGLGQDPTWVSSLQTDLRSEIANMNPQDKLNFIRQAIDQVDHAIDLFHADNKQGLEDVASKVSGKGSVTTANAAKQEANRLITAYNNATGAEKDALGYQIQALMDATGYGKGEYNWNLENNKDLKNGKLLMTDLFSSDKHKQQKTYERWMAELGEWGYSQNIYESSYMGMLAQNDEKIRAREEELARLQAVGELTPEEYQKKMNELNGGLGTGGGLLGMLLGDPSVYEGLSDVLNADTVGALQTLISTAIDSTTTETWASFAQSLASIKESFVALMTVLTGGVLGEDGEEGAMGEADAGALIAQALLDMGKAAETVTPQLKDYLNPELDKMAKSLDLTMSKTTELIETWSGGVWADACKAMEKNAQPAINAAEALGASASAAAGYYASWAAQIWAVINALNALANRNGTKFSADSTTHDRGAADIHVPYFASGTKNFRYGTAIVGEHGPELVTTGSTALNVFSNTQLMGEIADTRHALKMLSTSAEMVAYNRLMGGVAGNTSNDNSQNFTNNFNGAIIGDDKFREMIDEEVREVWRREMRLAS